MKSKTIVFTKLQTAELLIKDLSEVAGNKVKVKMEYTVVSGGTERACIMGMNNTSQRFPMTLGYCDVGYVIEIGEEVKKIKIGDRVLVYHGIHTEYNIVPESDVTKVESYPHHWTHHDDCRAILDMIATNRIDVKSIVSRVVKPEEAPRIYSELCDNKDYGI